ncbi:hypothetical protein [Kitasatospora sp. NPDC058218]|uniref:hypothetical protein n=1 Tax=Kitasatospora sp. NPDC058218 TaxID=3346385 RepID=UPI0036DF6DB0
MATARGAGPGPGSGQGGAAGAGPGAGAGSPGGSPGSRPGGPPGGPRRRAVRAWLGPWAAVLGGVGTLLAGVAAVLTWWQLTGASPEPAPSGGPPVASAPATNAPPTPAPVTAAPSTGTGRPSDTPAASPPGAAWAGTWRGTVTQGRQKYVVVVRIRDAQIGEEFAEAEYSPLGCSTVWLLTERLPKRLTGHERVTRNTATTCVNGDFVLELRGDGTILFDWGSSRATAVLARE